MYLNLLYSSKKLGENGKIVPQNKVIWAIFIAAATISALHIFCSISDFMALRFEWVSARKKSHRFLPANFFSVNILLLGAFLYENPPLKSVKTLPPPSFQTYFCFVGFWEEKCFQMDLENSCQKKSPKTWLQAEMHSKSFPNWRREGAAATIEYFIGGHEKLGCYLTRNENETPFKKYGKGCPSIFYWLLLLVSSHNFGFALELN